MNIILEANNKSAEDDGFVMKIVVAAIKNIQINISNVHICYEDSTTYKENIFQLGVSFSKLVFETELNKKPEKPANDNIINKMVKLDGFSIYLNSKKIIRLSDLPGNDINSILKSQISEKGQAIPDVEYILCPINFESKADIHRKPEADKYQLPIADLTMNLDSFHLQLNNHQISTMLLTVETIDRVTTAAPYRKWRPDFKKHPIKGIT